MRTDVSDRLKGFGTTIFSEMTQLANTHGAINLSQGFPDFNGDELIVDHVRRAMAEGHHQYARSMGHPVLVEAIAEREHALIGLDYDPMSEIVVTSGATEAIASAMFGILNPGDEVVLLEPFYDSYPAALRMAGGAPRYVTLEFPDFTLDEERLREVVSDRTRVIVLNTPHNPTGKVFSNEELEIIRRVALDHELIVVSDEVYEQLTFSPARHVSIASLAGMRERTLRISSAGKTYGFTGWKVGWALGPASLIKAVQAAHQFVTFATSTPMQVGLGNAMKSLPREFYDALRDDYRVRRDFLVDGLRSAGLTPKVPDGTYFITADFSRVFDGNDREFTRHLTMNHKVAAIPPSVFYARSPEAGSKLARFAFCKRMETLEIAVERIQALRL